MEDNLQLLKNLTKKILSGHELIKKLLSLENVQGVEKLRRKINQEIKFLEKVRSTGIAKKEHLQSTNLIHLDAMVQCLLSSTNPTEVLRPFTMADSKSRQVVDIVCNSGAIWIKVIARNPRALTLISLGNGEYGQKSVIDQAVAYLECAKIHPYQYKSPTVVFYFAYGIEMALSEKLENLGVLVNGWRIDSEDVYAEADPDTRMGLLKIDVLKDESTLPFLNIEDEDQQNVLLQITSSLQSSEDATIQRFYIGNITPPTIEVLNLDVSTLLAYITNMTNGSAHFVYLEPLLSLQAEWERSRPLKPFLEQLFHGKVLQVCKTAYDNFMAIIDIIGGPEEIARTCQFVKTLCIVEDATEGRILKLNLGGKIKHRSRIIFASGENTKSITVSANEGFVRAARMQGIECAVILHEPRSLSEVKERYAKKIE